MNRRLLWGLVGLAVIMGGAGRTEADYVYTTLDPPGSIITNAYGINDTGQIVGWYEDSAMTPHGFLYKGATYPTLDVPGSHSTIARGINDAGQIVGQSTDAKGSHGFLLSAGGYTTFDVTGAGHSLWH
jgi:probable HAF family extracellular repeat protein